MLSLRELERAARILDRDFAGLRIERWVQPDAARLVATLYGRDDERGVRRKRWLLLCAAPEVARVSELATPLPAAPTPPALCAYLRAHLSGARLARASIRAEDRQLAIRFEAAEGAFDLLLSLFGRRSNVYLLDAEGVLLATLRALRETRPELSVGAPFQEPRHGLLDAGVDRFADASDGEYLEAVERSYAIEEAGRETADLARRLSKAIRKESKSVGRRLRRVDAELAEAEEASLLQKRGDLLKGALGDVELGASEVTVADYATGDDVVIPLDPSKSPKQNLEAIFKKYHKFVRRLAKAGGRQAGLRAGNEQLTALTERVESLASDGGEAAYAELVGIAARPEIAKLLDKVRPRQSGAGGAPPAEKRSALPARLQNIPRKLVPRRFLSKDGLEIWVGRSDEGNDYLSTRLARGKDLFFHVEGSPGSHVVLRTEGREDPPSDSVLDACELAVRFSKQRNASRVDLHVVPIKNVKKPKGVKPGLVYVTGGKTVHLRCAEARLNRVLDSRIED